MRAALASERMTTRALTSVVLAAALLAAVGGAQVARPAAASADLAVSVVAPAAALYAQTATFTVTVTNRGPGTSDGVSLNVTSPTASTVTAASTAAGRCGTYPAAYTCTLGSLAAGGSATITVFVRAGQTATVGIRATVSAFTPDPDGANDAATASTTVQPLPADLAVTAWTDSATAPAGRTMTYRFSVWNNGGYRARATLSVSMPAGARVVLPDSSSSAGVSCSTAPPATVVCGVDLDPARSGVATVLASYPQVSAPTDVDVTGTLSIQGGSYVGNLTPGDDSASVRTTVTHAEATLTIDGSAPPAVPLDASSRFSQAFRVTNLGPDAADGVEVVLSPGGTPTLVVPPWGGYCAGTYPWHCHLGRIQPGASSTLTVTFAAQSAGDLTSTASASSATPGPATPVRSSATTRIVKQAATTTTTSTSTTTTTAPAPGPAARPVPRVTGATSAVATARLRAAGYRVRTTLARSRTVRKGRVIAQSPRAGTRLARGRTVTLVVSRGR